MANKRNRNLTEIIKYCKNCGLEVHTTTKARGHQGVFLHDNKNLKRIDISKNLPPERVLPVIAHEFAHFFHYSLDKSFESLQEIFGIKEEVLIPELENITDFIAGTGCNNTLDNEIEKIKTKIKDYETIIKQKYPHFKRSEKFLEFERYIKYSPAKYLLRYDRVKVMELFKFVVYSIDTLREQFPDMPEEFIAYINLKALMRHQRRFSSKKRKIKNYYSKSSELLARFVECWVVDKERLKTLAPHTFVAFEERINYKSFSVLKNFLELIEEECSK